MPLIFLKLTLFLSFFATFKNHREASLATS